MKYYAHTLRTPKGETLFTFGRFANERLTAQEFVKRTGAKHTFGDLAETQAGWQPLSSHLVSVADQSRNFAELFELADEGFLSGLLHDLGKYRRKFQLMLRGLEEEAPHAYAGSGACQTGGSAGFMAASFAIGGHHAGLANGIAANKERIQRQESVTGPSTELIKTALADFKERFDETNGTPEREGFAFTGRSRRPPRDRINCLLSFLYALVRHDCVAALTSAGLDPFVGFLHADRPNRPSLALDLMEEFRPWLADRLAVTLINRQQVGLEDFKAREGGAVELTDRGRKLIIQAYQERKKETLAHPLLEQTLRIGQLPFIQARVLARHLRGDLPHYVRLVPK